MPAGSATTSLYEDITRPSIVSAVRLATVASARCCPYQEDPAGCHR